MNQQTRIRLPGHGRRRLIAAAAAAVATAAAATVAAALHADAAVPPTPSGWTLVWSDDFTGAANSLPSAANWIIDTGTSYPGGPPNWGTGEIQTYTSSTANLRQDGSGNLVITPVRAANGSWTSARIETVRTDFKPTAGRVLRIEGRVQMPNVTGQAALGYWPAFWALGAPYRGNYQNWPSIGEFDIMENVNGINSVWGVLHCGVNPGGPCNETNGLGASRACPGSPCQGQFHTYRFEWDATNTSAQQLRWYVDGQQYHTLNQSQFDATTWSNMTNHAGYFLLINLAMGGGFPNGVSGMATPVAATQSGVPMLVDYVAVYQSGSTPTTPPGGQSAYSTIQAESYGAQSGVQTEATTDTGGGQNIGWLANGDWAMYPNIDFGATPATTFRARVASGAAGGISGQVQVRLDSPSAPVVAQFTVSNTGGWQSWQTVAAATSAITGVHNVYLTFSSGQSGDFVNVNWFTFGTSPPPTTTPPTTTPPTTTPPTTAPPGGPSAYSTIQAESYAQQSGVQVETTTDTGGGQNIGWLANGDWALYPNVNFGSTPAMTFRARVASGAPGGVSGLVQVRLGSPTAPVTAQFAVANTGGWQSWQTVAGNASGITGVHHVYLTFTSGQPADFVNVNWFTFATA
jgi:hypothetical protein